jgi:hypothetical protein
MEFNFVYALNYIIAIVWVLSIAYSLIKLRNLEINPTAQALWGVIILLIPFVGVIAFLLTKGKQLT